MKAGFDCRFEVALWNLAYDGVDDSLVKVVVGLIFHSCEIRGVLGGARGPLSNALKTMRIRGDYENPQM